MVIRRIFRHKDDVAADRGTGWIRVDARFCVARPEDDVVLLEVAENLQAELQKERLSIDGLYVACRRGPDAAVAATITKTVDRQAVEDELEERGDDVGRVRRVSLTAHFGFDSGR
jgi:hypothetical protein